MLNFANLIMVQHIKLPVQIQQHVSVPVWVLTVPILIQLPDTIPGKTMDDGISSWASVTCSGDPDGAPGARLQYGPDLAINRTSKWDVILVCVSVCLSLSAV